MSWLDNVDIQFLFGDIIFQQTDSMVCPVSVNIEAYGKISQTIFGLGAEKLNSDITHLKDKKGISELNLGQAISIALKSIHNIGPFKRLILVALWSSYNDYNENLFYKAYINSFREAFKNNQKSITLPIMAYDGHLQHCCKAIVKVIHDLDHLKKSSEFPIEEIYFVTNKKPILIT